jgi:hypothetical protein
MVAELEAGGDGDTAGLVTAEPHPEVVSGRIQSIYFRTGVTVIMARFVSRLPSIDLRQEPSDVMIILSGATKPIVAIIFAIVVFLILDLKVLDIQFGSSTGPRSNGLYLVSSFLCGFSERFATDIISRIPVGKKD